MNQLKSLIRVSPVAVALAVTAVALASWEPASIPGPADGSASGAFLMYGTVTDAITGAALSGCVVEVEGTGLRSWSAGDGRYRLVVSKSGLAKSLTVTARLAGYQPLGQSVRVAGDSAEVHFALHVEPPQPAPKMLEAVDMAQMVLGRAGAPHTTFAPSGKWGSGEAARMGDAGWAPHNTEEYGRIYDNPFLAASANPLSTFSIDVDAGSYSNVRRFLLKGSLPPADAVRVEELINYFDYDYPQPRGEDPVSITVEMAPAPWRPAHQLVHIGLQGRRIPTESLPPSNLVFLIDVSGSMDMPEKLPLLKSAFRMLVNQLRPEDRVAMVVYAGAAGIVLPSTPGSEKGTILDALERLSAGGSTAGGEGIRLAYRVAREHFSAEANNRVILASDGDFNVGVSSTSEMIRLVEEERKHGIFLTVLGFGMGNLKDERMEQIADKGNGHYAYIDSILEAKKVLVNELGATLVTVAQDVKLQIEFNPSKVAAYRLIGYENRLLRSEDFNDDTKDAGEMGAGHTVTALYEVIPVGVETDVEVRGIDSLRYQTHGAVQPIGPADEWMAVKLRYKAPRGEKSRLLSSVVRDRDLGRGSENLRFSAAVAAFGMLLRESEYAGQADFGLVLDLARGALGKDSNGYRREFIQLAEVARSIAPS